MSCPYADLKNIDVISIKPKLRPDPVIGTYISCYNFSCIWSEEHVTPTELNRWREQGDPVIDLFYQRYGSELKDGDDTYEFLKKLSEEHKETSDDPVVNFIRSVQQQPTWFNHEQAKRGQEFFLKHCSAALTSILHYTLVLGYGFQQLNDVLLKTQYLSSSDLSLTHRRLHETLQMIAKAMTGAIDNFDETFSDVVRVRLLHGMVRYKILKHQRTTHNQVPINQEDSIITLLGFSFSVLYCIEERMNIQITEQDKEDYLHLWRYIGWIIGIEDQFLYYLSSYRLARVISESIFYHFYLPTQISKHMVHHTLMAAYEHAAIPVSFNFLLGISQYLLGPDLSEALDLDQPKISRFLSAVIRFLMRSFQFFDWLGKKNYTKFNQWTIERNKQRLRFAVSAGLNHQLCNFALFKSYNSSIISTVPTPMKDCYCGYFQKKRTGIVKTNDWGLFRTSGFISLKPVFKQSLLLLLIIVSVRCLTNAVY